MSVDATWVAPLTVVK